MTAGSANRLGQTRELAQFASRFPVAEIPDLALDRARQAIADLVGVALAGRRHRIGYTILDYVVDQGARPVAGIFGGGRSSPELASLANGTFAHGLDFDDTNHPLYGHPSCSIVPALFATGEQTGATFGRAVAAYVIGVEIDAALGGVMMMAHSDTGFHSTGTIGTIGAAAAAVRMLNLDIDATQRALGIAASRAAGLRVNVGTMTKPLHAGAAAMSGVQAARLAARGWESHPHTLESPLGFCSAFLGPEGDRNVDCAAAIGQRWSLLEPNGLAIKAYPSCGATHPAIDAAVAVRAALDGEAIEEVRVGVSAQAPRLLVYDRPRTGNEGRFSAQYTVAAALQRGRVGLDDFTDAAVADPEVATLMDRVDVVVDDRHRDGTQYPASVRVRTVSGRLVERTVELARGKNANPLSEAELEAKFVSCAGAGSGQLWQAIRHAELDRPLADLMAATERFGPAGGR